MRLTRHTLDDCHLATGVVVVIDVIRAFTTAAYAFSAGAARIVLTDSVDAAFALRTRFTGSKIMGEVDGVRVAGFDYGNSPSDLAGLDLTGQTLIQRTTAGTQGMVRSTNADVLLGCSFVVARSTVDCLKRLAPPEVGLVITGSGPGRDGDEDVALADYLERGLQPTGFPDVEPYVDRVRRSAAGRLLADPKHPEFPYGDIARVTAVDRFPFVMSARKRDDGLLVMVTGDCVSPHPNIDSV